MIHGIILSPWTEDGKVNIDGQKWVCIPVARDILLETMLKGTACPAQETVEGLPRDAIYKGSFYDKSKLEAYFIFEHDGFQKLKTGDYIPTMRIVIKKIVP